MIYQWIGGPQTGSNRAPNTANKLSDFFVFLISKKCLGAVVGSSYSQIAHLGFRTYCNTVLDIFATSKQLTKYRSSEPLFITETIQKIQETIWTHFIKHISFVNLGIYNFDLFETCVPTCLKQTKNWDITK